MTAGLVLPARLWPMPEEDPHGPGRQLGWVLGLGVLGGLTLRPAVLGSAATVTGLAVLLLALLLRRDRSRFGLAYGLFAAGLLLVASVRAAEWLVVLCLLGTWALSSLALVPARTWTGTLVGAAVATVLPLRVARWFSGPLRRLDVPLERAGRGAAVAGVSLTLLLVFGVLFGTADPAYAHALSAVTPTVQVDALFQHAFFLCGVTVVAALAVYLAQRPPAVDVLAPRPARPVRPLEWLVPVVAVDLVFASFLAVQLAVLFGGRQHVLDTTGLSYAEYARHGFWQLLVVTALTLAVIAAAVRAAPRVTTQERGQLRVFLGLLCVEALVVVGSALHRMSLYEAAYGYTRLRVFVTAVELALGAVFLLLIVAGVRFEANWLPRAVVTVAALSLLGLVVLNPDAWIAKRNVERFRATGQIDTAYLSTLSADAVPALLSLPPRERACALRPIEAALVETPDPWYDGNLARHHARALLASTSLGSC